MVITLHSVMYLVGVLACGYMVWHAYCWFDSKREDRRKKAAKMGVKFAEKGANHLAELFICYGAGDYSGIWGELKHIFTSMEKGIDILEMEFAAIAASVNAENAAKVAAAKVAVLAPAVSG